MAEPNRKLAAILSSDVVGYSRLMQADEAATVATLKDYRAAIGRVVERHKGRVVNAPGDSILAEFPSAVEAVQAAVEIQKSIEGRNLEVAPERRMQFRVGVNVGDVIEEDDGTIYGDGVNIAARMEALADAGGICISSSVFDAVEGKLDFGFDFLGAQQVKNIVKPINVYRVRSELKAAQPRTAMKAVRKRRVLIGVAAVLALAVAGVGAWQYRTAVAPSDGDAEAALALPDAPSIAVLPFDNLSDDADQEYFADGLSDDLITDLSKIPGLFVIARNSSFTYKGKATKVQQVAADLGVRYILEGSVRRAGDTVRINAQLIDAHTGHHLWAERYDGTLANIFDLQEQVMGQIVASLAVELTGASTTLVRPAETAIPEAYDTFLEGREHLRRGTSEDLAEAIARFENAIALDPDYGRAYAALAATHWIVVTRGAKFAIGSNWQHAYEQAVANLAEARQRPTSSAYGLSAEILALWGRLDEALADVDQAMALDPTNPDHHVSKARILNRMGHAEEAEASARRALRVDPHFPPDYLRVLAISVFHQQRYEEAAELIERVVSRQPGTLDDTVTLMSAYGHLGRAEDVATAREMNAELIAELGITPQTVQLASIWWYGDIYEYDDTYRERLLDGLRKAGVPEGVGGIGVHADYRKLMSKSAGEYDVAGATKIDAATAKRLHERGVVFIDVRDPTNFRRGHVPGAVQLDLTGDLSAENLARYASKDDEIAFSCWGKYCPYSAYACVKALSWGYTRVYYFAGGIPAWEDAGYPVETSPGI